MSLSDQIFASEVHTRVVQVAKWPPVRIRELPYGAMKNGDAVALAEKVGHAMAMILLCCVDDDLNPVFTEEDIGKLELRPVSELMELGKHINAICGQGEEGLEDVAKNSESSPGEQP